MKIETTVAFEFSNYFKDVASEFGYKGYAFPLNGQDRDAGADFLLSQTTTFALVEFKSDETDIKKEKIKPKRLQLCRLLELNPQMQALHDITHFVGWANAKSAIHFNIYRHEVCNRLIFTGDYQLQAMGPGSASRKNSYDFVTEFLNGRLSLPLEAFEAYLVWLLEDASSSGQSSLSVAARDPHSKECMLTRFSTIRELYDWMNEKKPSLRLP
ncbi:hypothetical protein GCM10011390_09330 [Aureimonas endophytica]|uniref:Restriction endonuclease n=1 Tax=Aureimonas endophytica TaxID=2027858 RepID=A0A917E1M2_9HYPH|nr:hypothetical protein [Aureimonas endophytica]GGD92741.1 hypothetical protein GCM10011390_09330 [Aureimonas endophytica]